MYTGPKPPWPSLWSSEKLSVASAIWSKSKRENSESLSSTRQSLSTCSISMDIVGTLTVPDTLVTDTSTHTHARAAAVSDDSTVEYRTVPLSTRQVTYLPLLLRFLIHRTHARKQARSTDTGTATATTHSVVLLLPDDEHMHY